MKIVGKFKLNDVLYGIGIKNNKYYVGRIKDNKLYTYLSEDEKRLVDYILDAITPSDNMIKVAPVVVNDKKYDVFYSLVKNLFMFSPVPEVNDLRYLNSMFNNQDEKLYNKEIGSSIKNSFKRLIKVGKKTVVLLLSSAFMLSNAQVVKANVGVILRDDNKLINIVDMSKSFEISSDLLEKELLNEYLASEENFHFDVNSLSREDVNKLLNNAVMGNTNLGQQEKAFIQEHFKIVLDNYRYCNLGLIVQRLGSLKINYINNDYEIDNWEVMASGTYDSLTNSINFYNCKTFNDVKLDTFVHELFHVFQNNVSSISLFTEGTNAKAVDEYYFAVIDAYALNRKVVNFMGEIFGKDFVKKLYFNQDINLIRQEFRKVIPDDELIERFLGLSVQYGHISYKSNDKAAKIDEIMDILARFYEAKYNRIVEDDLVALSYYDCDKAHEVIQRLYSVPDDMEIKAGYWNKGNFINPVDEADVDIAKFKIGYKDQKKNVASYIEFDLDEVIEHGMARIENGKVVLEDSSWYYDDESKKVYRPGQLIYEDLIVEINESNRYLDSGMSR